MRHTHCERPNLYSVPCVQPPVAVAPPAGHSERLKGHRQVLSDSFPNREGFSDSMEREREFRPPTHPLRLGGHGRLLWGVGVEGRVERRHLTFPLHASLRKCVAGSGKGEGSVYLSAFGRRERGGEEQSADD
ncbi:hypothetical protein CDAR_526921 [Caerostris darwini]|uniref:Uncharacterized protein n=1 Tax=Caerostris darwini TaxID=1538125 RepID=A0AAV4Q348_9ARAC|nr:hypothetical protein CDAR_526921 [Caerostris darwini]